MRCKGGAFLNIILRELRAHRKSLIIWCISSIFLVASGMGKFSAVYSSGNTSMMDMFETMPKSLKVLLGVGVFDLTTAIGFFAILFVYLALMATIHATMLGSGVIGNEERDKTIEFLMVKPVSRKRVVISKLIAALINILIFNLVTLFTAIGMVGKYYHNGEPFVGDIVVLMVGLFILQLLFMSMGAFFAGISKKTKLAGSLSTSILLVMFILSIVAEMSDKISALKYMTPFKYYDAKTLLVDGGFNPIVVLLTLILIAGLVIAGTVGYTKRDLGH